MASRRPTTIALYPEERECAAPSAARIFDVFSGLTRHRLYEDGRLVEIFEPKLDCRQRSVLGLLGIPARAYETDK